MASTIKSAQLLIESGMHDALTGDPFACFDIGVALASGERSRDSLIEAHKWFSMAGALGCRPANKSSSELACGMSCMAFTEAWRRADVRRASKIRDEVAQLSALILADNYWSRNYA